MGLLPLRSSDLFLLRTSGIQTSFIPLGLSSVSGANAVFEEWRCFIYILFRKFQQIEVNADLVDNSADNFVGAAAFSVISWSDEVNTVLTKKSFGH